ncbi:MAG: type 2 isopentenyl-diphosphate Delta-isomerase [Acidobacteriota bacterium]|nr:type 2 isopentenyl-diphosphate Delta-isomerase [Acidobacteriota bacterium]
MSRLTSSALPSADEALDRDRKAEHIRLGLDCRMQLEAHYFEQYAFPHAALPEINFAEIDTSVEFLGKRLQAPLLISCMTGGTDSAAAINRNLAAAAEKAGVALGVGSQRRALEDPETAASFEVRSSAPTAALLANLGAVQLNYGCGIDECRRVVEMIGADALVLHLNPLQEAIQPEGQVDFSNLLPKMAAIVSEIEVPVIAKEIGCGISAATGRELARIGIEIVDTAGLGGTCGARIEGARADDLELGELFADWGIPTPDSIRELSGVAGLRVIGSGGLRNGIDGAKAIALGSSLFGMAYPFLAAATVSAEVVVERIERVVHELKICMFCLGCRDLESLRAVELVRRPRTS